MPLFRDFASDARDVRKPNLNDPYVQARMNVNALAAFGIYTPLEKRIQQVMHNIASSAKGEENQTQMDNKVGGV